jgi:hypothetical protein
MAIAGARLVGMDEGLQQQGPHPIARLPVRRQTAGQLTQEMGGQVGYADPRQDQETGVGHHAGEVAAAGGLAPAEPLIPIFEGEAGRLTGGGAQVTLGAVEQVAQLRPTQGLVPQGVLGQELVVGGAFRGGVHHHEVDGTQGGQVARDFSHRQRRWRHRGGCRARGPAGKGVAAGKVTAPRRWSSASARRALPRQRWPWALVQFSQSHTRSARARRLRAGS